MKSEHRHQLQQNELAERLEYVIEWSKRNAQLLTGVIVGAAVVLGIFFYLRHRWEESIVAGWNEFYSASESGNTMQLEALAGREIDELPGQLAALTLADAAFNAGVNQMNADRAEAEKQLNTAKNRYAAVRNAASDKIVKRRATLGLAHYYESLGLIDEAIQEYEQLVGDPSKDLYAAEAQQKIAFLKQPGTRTFAGWYREHKPLPPASSDFDNSQLFKDLHSLPSNEKSFPAATATGTPDAAAPAADPAPTPSATGPSATAPAVPAAVPSATAAAATGTAAPAATATGTAK